MFQLKFGTGTTNDSKLLERRGIIPTGKVRIRVYPRVGSGRVAIFGLGRVRIRVG